MRCPIAAGAGAPGGKPQAKQLADHGVPGDAAETACYLRARKPRNAQRLQQFYAFFRPSQSHVQPPLKAPGVLQRSEDGTRIG